MKPPSCQYHPENCERARERAAQAEALCTRLCDEVTAYHVGDQDNLANLEKALRDARDFLATLPDRKER